MAVQVKGWKVTIWISLALVALTVAQLAVWGGEEDGLRVVVRSSARSSVVLFALAFSARSLRSLWRRPSTKWLLANRRYLGVSYAVSHGVHALALVELAVVSPEFADSLDAVTLIGGGLAYVFTFAMASTSSDAAVRTLGRTHWQRLHLVGSWYIWIIFAQSYLPRAAMDPHYLIAGVIVLAVPALRFAAWTRRRSARLQVA